MKRRIVKWGLLLVMCLALPALAGQGRPPALPPTPPGAAALSTEQRLENVRRALAENGIDFQVSLSLGDDGRLVVRIVAVDLRQRAKATPAPEAMTK